jgi:hypothetical protein
MADLSLLTMTQITEAQQQASVRMYGVYDPAGTPQDVWMPVGAFIGGYYKIAPSVASNNLTVAVQHLDGSDPSTENPLGFKIGNSWQLVTSSLSTTKAAGTSWCNLGKFELAANTHDLFTYVIQETGASAGTKFGFSRIPYAKTMADFNSTSTDEKYIAGNYTNKNATDEVALIGRFAAQLSAASSFNWSIPSALVCSYPIYQTEWRTFVPTGTLSGAMTYLISSRDVANYMIDYNECAAEMKVVGTTGGSAANTISISAPFGATNGNHLIPRGAYFTDGGGVLTGHCTVGNSTLNVSKYDNSNFGLGAGRYISSAVRWRIG